MIKKLPTFLRFCTAALALIFSLHTAMLRAELSFPAVFNHHMVLQREMPVPVFGKDLPGTTVTVEFGGQKKQAIADDKGIWKAVLDPMQASAEGRELTASGSSTVILKDILVGEVWMGAGQSNMVIPVSGAGYPSSYARDQDLPLIRYSRPPSDKERKPFSKTPHDMQWNPEWMVCTKENIPKFGGIMFAFADALHRELQVPIGIVNRAVGGTPVRFHLDQGELAADPFVQQVISEANAQTAQAAARAVELEAAYPRYVKEIKERVAATGEKISPVKKPVYATPSRIRDASLTGKKGVGYIMFIEPMLGMAMRGVVWDQGESGTGMLNGRVGLGMSTRFLIRQWRQHWPELPFIVQQKPSGQGRNTWGRLAPEEGKNAELPPTPPTYPWTSGHKPYEYLTLKDEPGTWMVNTMDLITSVHPGRKDMNGLRASEIALSEVYGIGSDDWRAPAFEKATFQGDTATVHFRHIGEGLTVKGTGTIQGFALAGEDQVFHWADAVIEGETVKVSSAKVSKPVAVRYAYAKRAYLAKFSVPVAPWANLFGANGRPVQIFRSDDWENVP